MIAALILAHHSPGLLGRLVKRLGSFGATCFVHVDDRVELGPFESACVGTGAVFVQPRIAVTWGGFSLVRATVSVLSAALLSSKCSHFVLMSGDSYPIKPLEQFRQLIMRPCSQIRYRVIAPTSRTYERISLTFLPDTHVPICPESNGGLSPDLGVTEEAKRVFTMKESGFPWRYAKGDQWWVLTEEAAQKCIEIIARQRELIEWFKYSWVPDEALFHTIIENFGPFRVQAEAPIYTLWDGGAHPREICTVSQLNELKETTAPLARKFSTRDGTMLIDLLDKWFDESAGIAQT